MFPASATPIPMLERTTAVTSVTAAEDHPVSWRWADDGPHVTGQYVRMDEAATSYGPCPIVVLNINGVKRSVWLLDTALVSKFRDQLATRSTGDFTEGERIVIERGTEKVEGGNGRSYWPYRVRFPDAPRRRASDILGVGDQAHEDNADEAYDDDHVPY